MPQREQPRHLATEGRYKLLSLDKRRLMISEYRSIKSRFV
jgi:hypothetical protein